MSNVERMPKAERGPRKPVEKIGVQLAFIPGLPTTDENCLGQLRWVGDTFEQVEVLVLLEGMEVGRSGKARRRRRTYIVDSVIEGARLLYRVAGFPHAIIEPSASGLRVTLPPVAAGSTDGPARAA